MFEKLLSQVKIRPEDFLGQEILTEQALKEINKFYQRIENLLKDPSFAEKREHYAHEHVILHSQKVAFYSMAIAQAMKLPLKDHSEITLASMLHDIDKLYWPAQLLDKPKHELSKTDWTRIMEHAMASAIFVERLTKHQISQGVLTIIKQHHENLDGTGYPERLTEKDICIGAKIVRVTDSYDSMTSTRPYKKQVVSHDAALADLKRKAGGTYDPDIVKVFEETLPYDKISSIPTT